MAAAALKRNDPQSLGLIPVESEEEKRRRKKPPAQTPRAVQPARPSSAPPISRGTDPRSLGLVPLDPDTEDQPTDDFSPEALGLVPLGAPQQGTPPPQEDTVLDWATHKANQFVGLLQDTFGIEHAPEPANADMTRVEDGPPQKVKTKVKDDKLFEDGTLLDAVVPDFVENAGRAIGDFATSKRTQRNLDAGVSGTMAGFGRLAQNAVSTLNFVNDFLVEETGIGQKSTEDDALLGESWAAFEERIGKKREEWERSYAALRQPDDERTFVDALVEAAPQIPVMVAEFGAAAVVMGPVAGFAAIEALTHADEGVEGAAVAGLKGAAMGAFFEWANVLSRPLRVGALAVAGGGVTALEGGKDADIIAQSILFPVLGLPGRSGPIGARYLREHGVVADVRDLGGHVRDLLIGGNVGRSKRDLDVADATYKGVQRRHHEETQAEQARLAVEISAARAPQPGEFTPAQADIDARVNRVQAESQARMEELRVRQMKIEMEARHNYDMAARRHARALAPFRTSFAEAPHARALQSAERKVLIENQDGFNAIQSANKEAEARLSAAKERAVQLRKEAEAEVSPEGRKFKHDLADHMEAEGARLAYEMRRRVEDHVEERIIRAEARAEEARHSLAETLGKRNVVAGRRARVLAADRDVQESSRSGIRRLNRGNERAKLLLIIGDEHVARVERRLRQRGITKDDPTTGAEYDSVMLRANELRETYREMASQELLSAQYAADSRVSRAMHRRDMALQAAESAGLPVSRLNRKEASDPTKRSEEDNWDLPDEPTDIRRGPEFEHAYRKALEGSRDDPMVSQIAADVDPILQRIQDPSDVLPAINRVAKELGHKSKSTRGRQTESKRQILAEQLGMSEKEFIDSPYGKAFSDYEIEGALMLIRRQWQRVKEAHAQFKKTNSKVDGDRVRLEVTRMVMIMERLRGAAAEAGRALRMFREVKKEFGGVRDVLTDSQIDKIMFYDKPGTAYKIAKKFLRGDYFGGLVEFYINGLLSGFQTWFVNLYSGIGMLAYKPLQSAVAASIGLTRWAAYNVVGRPLIAPFRAVYRAMARTGALGRYRKEQAQARAALVGQAREQANEFAPNAERVRFGEVGARVRGMFEAVGEAVHVFFKSLFTGEKFLNETNFGGHTKHIPWWMGGEIIRFPGRILQAIDDFVKVLSYRSGIRANAYREAIAESHNLPNTPAGWKMRRDRYQELARNPNGKVLAEAKAEALEATFQQEPSKGFKWVSTMRRDAPVSAFLVPFHRILLNSLEWLVSGTPLFPLYKKVRMDLFGANGRARQDMALAHLMLVSGSSFAIYMWALGGNTQSGYGGTEAQRTAQGIAGPPPLAVRVPGTEDYVTLNRVDPIGGIISLGISAAEVSKAAHAEGDEDKAQRAFSILVSGVFSMSLERAGLRGLVDFIEAIQGGQFGNDINSLDRYFEKLGATILVPQASAVIARTQDPYMRYAHTLMEQIMSRVPGQRSQLWPVRNMWGSPIVGYDSYGPNDALDLTQPFYWGKRSKDPASLVILKLFDIYRWAPGTLDRTIEGRRLTDEEYDAYAQATGRYSYENIRAMAESPEWQAVEALDAKLRAVTKSLAAAKNPNTGARMDEKEYAVEVKKQDALREELRKARFRELNRAKKLVSAARKKARADVLKRFPIMERQRKKDLSRVSGETPDYFDHWANWFNAEDENERWQADENAASEGEDLSTEDREDAANDAANKAARERLARERTTNAARP